MFLGVALVIKIKEKLIYWYQIISLYNYCCIGALVMWYIGLQSLSFIVKSLFAFEVNERVTWVLVLLGWQSPCQCDWRGFPALCGHMACLLSSVRTHELNTLCWQGSLSLPLALSNQTITSQVSTMCGCPVPPCPWGRWPSVVGKINP